MQQLTLTLIGGLAQMPLWFATPKRPRRAKTGVFAPWPQLLLKLPIRKLIRNGSHFIWTRPIAVLHAHRFPRVVVWAGLYPIGPMHSSIGQLALSGLEQAL